MLATGQFEYEGYQWYYFDLGAVNAGSKVNPIANNNSGGKQVDVISDYTLGTDNVLYYIITPNGTDYSVTQAFSPEEVVEILRQ